MLQPCCNRSRTQQDRVGKQRRKKRQKIAYIAGFPDRTEPTRKALTELTRRGSLVQIQHRPLKKAPFCRQKVGQAKTVPNLSARFDTTFTPRHPGPTGLRSALPQRRR